MRITGQIFENGSKIPSAYALDTVLPLTRGCKRDELEREMKHHIIDSATLMGRYSHCPDSARLL